MVVLLASLGLLVIFVLVVAWWFGCWGLGLDSVGFACLSV